jgi:transposase
MHAGQVIGWMSGLQVVGMDIAKSVFQLYTVDMKTGELRDKRLKRDKVLEFFRLMAPAMVAMEACGGAHHWARQLQKLGHKVRLVHARAVRPFVQGNKTDVTDARAIWLAVQQSGMRFVAVKTEAQQAALTLHRQRQQLVKMITMQLNGLRGLLYEFGVTLPLGRKAMLAQVVGAIDSVAPVLPKMTVDSLLQQVQRIDQLRQAVDEVEVSLKQLIRQDQQMQRALSIPGVGILSATAAVATMGDPHHFKSGREFCAWLGLVPRQEGTGGKVKLLGISKRGDKYVRTLLVHGARAVLLRKGQSSDWQAELQKRRHKNVAIVAQAAKIARTIWAVLAKDQDYQANHKSVRPQQSSAAAQEPSQDGSPTCPPRRSFVAGDARRRGQVS